MFTFLILVSLVIIAFLFYKYTKLKPLDGNPDGDSDIIYFMEHVIEGLRSKEKMPPLGVSVREKDVLAYLDNRYLWAIRRPSPDGDITIRGTEEMPLEMDLDTMGAHGAMSTGMDGEGFLYMSGEKFSAVNQDIEWNGAYHSVFIVSPFDEPDSGANYIFKSKNT